jgi:hypothetical protein
MKKEELKKKVLSNFEQVLENTKLEVSKKIETQKKQIETKLNTEIDTLEKIITLISQKVLYKKHNNKYILVTENVLLEDYSRETKYGWQKGVEYKEEDDYRTPKINIKVNGESYHHIGYLLYDYEKQLNDKIKTSHYQWQQLTEQKEVYDNLRKQEPMIIKLITDFQTMQDDLVSYDD